MRKILSSPECEIVWSKAARLINPELSCLKKQLKNKNFNSVFFCPVKFITTVIVLLLKSPTIFEALIEMRAWKCGSVFSNVNLLKATSLITKVKENTQTSLQQTIKTSPGKLTLLDII